MFKFITKTRAAAAVALTSIVTGAMAAPLAVPAELTDALSSVAVIGAAVFAISVGVKVYKWVTRAL